MASLRTRPPDPPTFKQILVLARTTMTSASPDGLTWPTMDDGEWKAQTKDLLTRTHFEYPHPDQLDHAIAQVEAALTKTWGPRPVPMPSMGTYEPTPAIAPEGRTHHPPGWELIGRLLRASSYSNSSPAHGPLPSYVLTEADEPEILDTFWRSTQDPDYDRLKLLRAFAELAILREAAWVPPTVRAVRLAQQACFACGVQDRALVEHHIIQPPHGGSDTPRNRVVICDVCQGEILPWLDAPKRRAREWSSLGDAITTLVGEPPPAWLHLDEFAAGREAASARRARHPDLPLAFVMKAAIHQIRARDKELDPSVCTWLDPDTFEEGRETTRWKQDYYRRTHRPGARDDDQQQ